MLSSAKPKPHRQQKSLKVKDAELEAGRWRGDTLHYYFWVETVLKQEHRLVVAAAEKHDAN